MCDLSRLSGDDEISPANLKAFMEKSRKQKVTGSGSPPSAPAGSGSQPSAPAGSRSQPSVPTGQSGSGESSAPSGDDPVTAACAPNDFGLLIGGTLSDEEKLAGLTKRWRPSSKNEYPVSFHDKGGVRRPRRLLPHHLDKYSWLAISRKGELSGAWCSVCVIFGESTDVFVLINGLNE